MHFHCRALFYGKLNYVMNFVELDLSGTAFKTFGQYCQVVILRTINSVRAAVTLFVTAIAVCYFSTIRIDLI